jgi:hypothetical protein
MASQILANTLHEAAVLESDQKQQLDTEPQQVTDFRQTENISTAMKHPISSEQLQ